MRDLRRLMKREHFQIVVLGSGFGGSLTAMIARRLGFSTALVERGKHPRFAIGESSTPLANLLLEEIAADHDLPFLRPLCRWGSWQRQLPHLACGLKRGFTFYHHEPGRPFADPDRLRQLLVGASPNEDIADTHWYRPDFDHHLVQQAQKLGVVHLDETDLEGVVDEADGMRLSGIRQGGAIEISAEFVIDATGPRGFLHRALGLEEQPFATLPPTQGLFAHFRDVGPLPAEFSVDGLTPPYPPEQAAVHHVFPGGWIWVLKFNNGITSAGVTASDDIANELKLSEGAAGWRRLLQGLPSLAEVFLPARTIVPFVHSPRLAFRSRTAAGRHWALLPSAAGFVDPLLSTGFPLTLLGIKRLAKLMGSWRKPSFGTELRTYSDATLREVDAAADLVGALHATTNRFELFKELSLLYFAAASFSETARRLGKAHLADSFLLCGRPDFANRFHQLCAQARQADPAGAGGLKQRIREAIEPFDVAGLTDDARHPWYPALAEDLAQGARKLGAGETEIATLLRECGLGPD